MASVYIIYRVESQISRGNVLGARVGGHEDSSTSTSVETDVMPGGATVVEIFSPDADHVIEMVAPGGTPTVSSGAREIVPVGVPRVFEIPGYARGGGTIGYRTLV